MSVTDKAISKLKSFYENNLFKEFLFSIIDSKEFIQFLTKRINEKNDYSMNIKLEEYFKNFRIYPDRVKQIVVVDSHTAIEKLRSLGYYTDLNSVLFLVLNNTYSKRKDNPKSVKLHYDYWRIFTSEALDYLTTLNNPNYEFHFIGDDVVYDFAELVGDSPKFLLPSLKSQAWKNNSMKEYDFIPN